MGASHSGAVEEGLRRILEDDPPRLDDVSAIRMAEGDRHVLLDEQEARPFRSEAIDNTHERLDRDRGEPRDGSSISKRIYWFQSRVVLLLRAGQP